MSINVHNADLQARDSEGKTALHYAVEQSQVQRTKELLEKGADVNVSDNQGETPLLLAVHANKADELVALLVKYGADVTVRNFDGCNALHYLAWAKVEHVKLARVLIEKGVSLDDRTTCQALPIHEALEEDKNELVKLYLDLGSDVNAQNEYGEFPLYIAATNDNPIALKAVLEHGANVNLGSMIDGRTALHRACSGTTIRTEILRQLLSAGADVLAEDFKGKTVFALLKHKNDSIGTRLMMKSLAMRKVCLDDPSVEFKDEGILKEYPDLWTYYQDCIAHVRKMKYTKFIESCSFFELLTKCQCQIAPLMRNPEFRTKFKRNRTVLTMFVEDVRQAFERVENRYLSMKQQEDLLNEAVYGLVPHLIVRKVVDTMWICCNKNKK